MLPIYQAAIREAISKAQARLPQTQPVAAEPEPTVPVSKPQPPAANLSHAELLSLFSCITVPSAPPALEDDGEIEKDDATAESSTEERQPLLA